MIYSVVTTQVLVGRASSTCKQNDERKPITI